MTAIQNQVGGNHYKDQLIQPLEVGYCIFNGDSCATKVFKYLTREKDNWAQQIDKAHHVFLMYYEGLHEASPIKALTPAQSLLLRLFVEEQPAPLQETFYAIASMFIARKQGEHFTEHSNQALHIQEHHDRQVIQQCFANIRTYYLKKD